MLGVSFPHTAPKLLRLVLKFLLKFAREIPLDKCFQILPDLFDLSYI